MLSCPMFLILTVYAKSSYQFGLVSMDKMILSGIRQLSKANGTYKVTVKAMDQKEVQVYAIFICIIFKTMVKSLG